MTRQVRGRYTQSYLAGVGRYGAGADTVHTGATWRIRLNHPCAAAMRPYVKFLLPLVLFESFSVLAL